MTTTHLSLATMAEVGSSLLSATDHLILTTAAACPASQTLGAPRVVVHATGYIVFFAFPTLERDAMRPWIEQGASGELLALFLDACNAGCCALNIDAHSTSPRRDALLSTHLNALTELGIFEHDTSTELLAVNELVLPSGHYVTITDGHFDLSVRTQRGKPEELDAYVAGEREKLARKLRRLLRIAAGSLQLKDRAARKAA